MHLAYLLCFLNSYDDILAAFLLFYGVFPVVLNKDADTPNHCVEKEYINTVTFPQKIDDITQINEILTSSRGIVYLYEINLRRDQFPLSSIDSIKKNAISTLCNNPALVWYKNNDVNMSYVYFDNKEDMISLFNINSKNC